MLAPFDSRVGMSVENWISLLEALGVWAGAFLVVKQLGYGNRQQNAQALVEQARALVEIYNMNLRLISMGFKHPKLFAILADKKTSPVWERRYLQLLFNLFSLIHIDVRASVFEHGLKENLMRDLTDFFANRNVRRHWGKYGSFYAVPFQNLVNGIIEEIKKREPPPTAAAAPQLNTSRD